MQIRVRAGMVLAATLTVSQAMANGSYPAFVAYGDNRTGEIFTAWAPDMDTASANAKSKCESDPRASSCQWVWSYDAHDAPICVASFSIGPAHHPMIEAEGAANVDDAVKMANFRCGLLDQYNHRSGGNSVCLKKPVRVQCNDHEAQAVKRLNFVEIRAIAAGRR